jgi:hypothetical protein
MILSKKDSKSYMLMRKSHLSPLVLEKLIALTPEGRHFPFPSERNLKGKTPLQNVQKYTCLLICGISFFL